MSDELPQLTDAEVDAQENANREAVRALAERLRAEQDGAQFGSYTNSTRGAQAMREAVVGEQFKGKSQRIGGAAQALLEDKALHLREARELALCAARLLEASENVLRGGCPKVADVAMLMLAKAKALLGDTGGAG